MTRPLAALANFVTLVCLAAGLSSSAGAQGAPASAQPAVPEFRTGTAVVLLDVIARDKKGRPVPDLRPEEIQVFENDQRCDVREFRYVESQASVEPGAAAAVAPTAAVEPPPAPQGRRAPLNIVTMVFDRLSLEDQRLAEKAARDFIERGMDPRTQVAVFSIGTRLGLVQEFTSDKAALLKAVAMATSGANLEDRSLTADARRTSRDVRRATGFPVMQEPGEGGDASVASGERLTQSGTRTPGSSVEDQAAGLAEAERKQREWVANALSMADSLQRQMEGQWSLYPLLALVKAQSRIAGRKTLLYFSPGLQVPPNLDDVFKTVISEANRSNVSVYSVDSRGLSARADIQASGAALRDAAMTSMQQQMKGAGEATTAAEMNIMDTAETSMRLNVQQTLGDLAEGTGGFLVANANDFGRAVDRLAADIRGYYELTYAPAVANFDGSFRRISVKVTRKEVVLQSRSGYFALPPSDQLMLPYEMPLLAALSAASPARDFAHQAAALRFTPSPDGTETAVVVEVPLGPLDFAVDQKKKTFELKLTTLAVVRDAEGRIVERFSDEYPLGGPLAQLDSTKQSNAVLRRTALLGPGRYTLETASRTESGRTSVQRTSFEVPELAMGPMLSSLALLRRADPLPADAPASEDPFRVEGVRVVPHLAGPVSKAANPNLSFFARLYPAPGGEAPTLTLEFVREGKTVGRASPPLSAADANGNMALLSGVPSASFPPGQYDVRLKVLQGDAEATETTHFELVP